MFKDKNLQERKALIQSQYAANLEQLDRANELRKNSKRALVILKNQLEALKGLENLEGSDDSQ